jgi:NitT/TauT family transport system substrate-binding protein
MALLVASFPAWGEEKTRVESLRIGIPSYSLAFLPVIAAESLGFYRGEKLNVELIQIRSAIAIQALVAGELDFTTIFTSSTRAALSGLPVRHVMVLNTAIDHVLVVSPKIHTMQELKGKMLGVGSVVSMDAITTRMALEKYGLIPDEDVKILALGGGSDTRIAALRSGRVAGTMLAMPYNKIAVKAGFKELLAMREVTKVPTADLSTTVRKIKTTPSLIVQTIGATLRATRFIKENKNETLELMSRKLGIKDRELASQVYDEYITLYPDTGIPPDSSMMEDALISKKALGIQREVQISDVADWSFARKALKELMGR